MACSPAQLSRVLFTTVALNARPNGSSFLVPSRCRVCSSVRSYAIHSEGATLWECFSLFWQRVGPNLTMDFPSYTLDDAGIQWIPNFWWEIAHTAWEFDPSQSKGLTCIPGLIIGLAYDKITKIIPLFVVLFVNLICFFPFVVLIFWP